MWINEVWVKLWRFLVQGNYPGLSYSWRIRPSISDCWVSDLLTDQLAKVAGVTSSSLFINHSAVYFVVAAAGIAPESYWLDWDWAVVPGTATAKCMALCLAVQSVDRRLCLYLDPQQCDIDGLSRPWKAFKLVFPALTATYATSVGLLPSTMAVCVWTNWRTFTYSSVIYYAIRGDFFCLAALLIFAVCDCLVKRKVRLSLH